MKTLGIIGGLGPETTAEFYQEVVFSFCEKHMEQKPQILIWNVPIPVEVEQNMLMNAEGAEAFIPFLVEAAKILEHAGADFLVMPCNTMHIFIQEIRDAVDIPVLSITEEVVAFLQKAKLDTVGLVATPQAMQSELYTKELGEANIERILPDDFAQARIGKMIDHIVQNRHSNSDRQELQKIVSDFVKQDVQTVLLACTDLQLLIPHHPSLQIFDTMKVFAEATVQKMLEP